MEDINKPDWLKAFEEDAKAFNESKFGKMTQRGFINHINAKHTTKEQCIKGAEATNQLAKKQEEELGHSFRTIQFNNIKTTDHQTKAAKIAGQKNVESGHWKKVQEAAKESLKIEHTCIYCNKTLKGLNYRRWHGDNCKLNPNKNK